MASWPLKYGSVAEELNFEFDLTSVGLHLSSDMMAHGSRVGQHTVGR